MDLPVVRPESEVQPVKTRKLRIGEIEYASLQSASPSGAALASDKLGLQPRKVQSNLKVGPFHSFITSQVQTLVRALIIM